MPRGRNYIHREDFSSEEEYRRAKVYGTGRNTSRSSKRSRDSNSSKKYKPSNSSSRRSPARQYEEKSSKPYEENSSRKIRSLIKIRPKKSTLEPPKSPENSNLPKENSNLPRNPKNEAEDPKLVNVSELLKNRNYKLDENKPSDIFDVTTEDTDENPNMKDVPTVASTRKAASDDEDDSMDNDATTVTPRKVETNREHVKVQIVGKVKECGGEIVSLSEQHARELDKKIYDFDNQYVSDDHYDGVCELFDEPESDNEHRRDKFASEKNNNSSPHSMTKPSDEVGGGVKLNLTKSKKPDTKSKFEDAVIVDSSSLQSAERKSKNGRLGQPGSSSKSSTSKPTKSAHQTGYKPTPSNSNSTKTGLISAKASQCFKNTGAPKWTEVEPLVDNGGFWQNENLTQEFKKKLTIILNYYTRNRKKIEQKNLVVTEKLDNLKLENESLKSLNTTLSEEIAGSRIEIDNLKSKHLTEIEYLQKRCVMKNEIEKSNNIILKEKITFLESCLSNERDNTKAYMAENERLRKRDIEFSQYNFRYRNSSRHSDEMECSSRKSRGKRDDSRGKPSQME